MLWRYQVDSKCFSNKSIKSTNLVFCFSGCATLSDIKKDMVVHEAYYSRL